jgi:proteasome-associated ATPase
VVTLKEVLDGRRAWSSAAPTRSGSSNSPSTSRHRLRAGDNAARHPGRAAAREAARPEVEELVLEEVPDITYADVGGLDEQIEQITDAVELPFLHQQLFAEYDLCRHPRASCSTARPAAARPSSRRRWPTPSPRRWPRCPATTEARSYFLNIKGPELLNKYVGETERQIRLVFQRAREKSEEGWPVIVFFDEMDSLFRTRGSGISSDIESTIVPQLLAEIDGVETLKNVIVIGASNREDLIDPAILRPGRLDVKIKIERPDEESAAIFARYLTDGLPLDEDEVRASAGATGPTRRRGDDRAHRREMYRTDEPTSSSRSPTRTATRRSCTSRTSPRGP